MFVHSRKRLFTIGFILFSFSGCGKTAITKTEDLPPEDLTLPSLSISDRTEGVKTSKLVTLNKKATVKRGRKFAITGILHVTNEKYLPGLILISIRDKRVPGETHLKSQNFARLVKIEENKYRYRAEIKPLKKRGVYEIQIVYIRDNNVEENQEKRGFKDIIAKIAIR